VGLVFAFWVSITIASCSGDNCKELPISFTNYNQAKEIVLNSTFKVADDADVSNSSWINSAKYFSCDGVSGFFIIATGNRFYIHKDLLQEIWERFKRKFL
jgi:hypothetical protein